MEKYYVKRNEGGALIGIARWPMGDEPAERLNEDHPDIVKFFDDQRVGMTSLSSPQIFAMLAAIDIDEPDIQQVISAQSDDPIEREFMRQKMDRQQIFKRHDPLLLALFGKSGRSENEINDLWMRCSQMI